MCNFIILFLIFDEKSYKNLKFNILTNFKLRIVYQYVKLKLNSEYDKYNNKLKDTGYVEVRHIQTSTIDGGQSSAWRSGRFTPEEEDPSSQ